jgi:hypothetical protein
MTFLVLLVDNAAQRDFDFLSSVFINPKAVQGISKMLGHTSGVSSPPHRNKENLSYQYLSANTSGTAPTFARTQSLRFLSVGTLKNPGVFI